MCLVGCYILMYAQCSMIVHVNFVFDSKASAHVFVDEGDPTEERFTKVE